MRMASTSMFVKNLPANPRPGKRLRSQTNGIEKDMVT